MRAFTWLYSQPYILLFLATLFWAGNAVAGKFSIGHVSPFLLTSLRWLVACIIVVPIAFKILARDLSVVRERLLFLFVLGATGFSVFNNLMYSALQTTSAMNVAIIQAALPASIFLLNFMFYRMSANRYQLLGFPITVVGVITIVSQGQIQVLRELSFVAGDILMLLAITFYGIYSVMLNKKPDIHWLSLICVLSVSAWLVSLPFVALESLNKDLIRPDITGWLMVLYSALCASLLAQVFWIRGIELIGSNAASLFINLVPIWGTIFAIILLGEVPYGRLSSDCWWHCVGSTNAC